MGRVRRVVDAAMVSRRGFLSAAAFAVYALAFPSSAQVPAPTNPGVAHDGWKPFPQDLVRFFKGTPGRIDISKYAPPNTVKITLVGPPLPEGITFDGTAFVSDGLGPIHPVNAPNLWTLVATDGVLLAVAGL